MSQENVGIVRREFEVYGRGVYGPDRRAKALETFDPDVVHNSVDERPSYGLDAYMDYCERWEAAWEELEQTTEEYIGAGDRVVATAYLRARGRGSGVEVETRFYYVYTLRDGKIVRIDEFTEREKALEAAGLSE
jgi:ketosteroid isomerase-like protein